MPAHGIEPSGKLARVYLFSVNLSREFSMKPQVQERDSRVAGVGTRDVISSLVPSGLTPEPRTRHIHLVTRAAVHAGLYGIGA